jgi:hypothetical protein
MHHRAPGQVLRVVADTLCRTFLLVMSMGLGIITTRLQSSEVRGRLVAVTAAATVTVTVTVAFTVTVSWQRRPLFSH